MFNLTPTDTVLVFGEIMMRLSPPDNLRLEQAASFDARYGGAEANVAVSLAYQGDNSALVSVVPPNRIGDCALRSIGSWGVDTSRVVRSGDRLGTYFFEVGASERSNGVVYDRKYSAINLASADELAWDQILEGVSVLYFSGTTPAVSDEMARACREGLEAARERRILTVCDLNYRGKMWGVEKARSVMRTLLPMVDVCIANDEDSSACLGISHGSGSLACGIDEADAYVAIARDICSEYGCKAVASVVRNIRSVEDSDWMGLFYLAEGEAPYFSPVHHVHVLEGVAAGDAFAGALLHALLHGFGPQEAIDYAIAGSVLKLTVRGDFNIVSEDEIRGVMGSGSGLRVSR